jgi:16S rRNA processing protein RimM
MGLVKDDFIATIKGIDDRTAAENLRGTKLFVSRDKLPKAKDGEYYEADLQGLEAKTEDGETIGTIEALHDYGAGSFLEIKPQKGPSFMLPFTDAHVPTVDIEKGFATVLIPEGWLNVEKPEKKGKKP